MSSTARGQTKKRHPLQLLPSSVNVLRSRVARCQVLGVGWVVSNMPLLSRQHGETTPGAGLNVTPEPVKSSHPYSEA